MVKVLGIVGSLRKGSYNRMALAAAAKLAPAGMEIGTAELAGIPPYDEDLRQAGLPDAVARLRRGIAEADALLIVSPEYNFSIPGVLKNAIDWASRPPDQPFNEKPVAIMGCAPGNLGTARMQYHLRQVLVFLNAFPINKPEVMIGQAAQKFDAAGNLADAATAEFIRQLLEALASWSARVRR
jgi:chromate reductase, NAD(P)H dehydrogenase (quinone)